MTEFEFWQHLQRTGQMTYGWWYSVAAIPALIMAVSLFLITAFAMQRVPKYTTRFIWLALAATPVVLSFPAFFAVTNLRASLQRINVPLPNTPQELAYQTTIAIGTWLNTLALWALIGVSLAVPIVWGSFLIGDVPVVSPIVKHATKTITNVATRAFSGRGPGAAGRIKTRYGTLTINRGQKKGAIEAVRPNIVIGARGDIQLNDIGISRNHARIQIEGDQVALVDLDSTNGTFLRRDNQVQPLNGVPMPLQHGDLIYLGDPDLPTSIELLYQRQEV